MKKVILLYAFCSYLIGCTGSGSVREFPADLSRNVPLQLGCWFWRGEELQGDGYKPYIDLVSTNASYQLLTQTFRIPDREITDPLVHDQVKLAAEYALQKGILMATDLDVRLARRAFMEKYPDEMQEMLILTETGLAGTDPGVVIYSRDLNDHYTHRTEHYVPLEGKIRRVYAFRKSPEGIEPASLKDITGECGINFCSKDSIGISLPGDEAGGRTHACAMVSFTHLAADVFAPNLVSFQRELIERYADVPLAGVCKDEWGFPPCFYETFNEFWYSDHRAAAYAERNGGRELLGDCLLMAIGMKGMEREQLAAINHFREMSRERNSELEDDFYHTVKEVFGKDAFVATHPTWYPYPGFREYKKNGLHWWAATRDWAQTDEVTPFAVRTALTKKWGSPVWYNMYYASDVPSYERSVWSHALGGGRINYHPVYPSENYVSGEREVALLKGDLMLAESRVRLLNYISESPLNCPVAVVFGHACAMNWAGPAYDDPGMELADSLWKAGIPADLIPSTELKHLGIDSDGFIHYGEQRYAALVLYHPEFENESLAGYFRRAGEGKTALFRMGDWTMDSEAKAFDGNRALPGSMKVCEDLPSLLSEIRLILQKQSIPLHTPADDSLTGFGYVSSSPRTTGTCYLLDGTMIHVAGTDRVSGDPIQLEMNIQGKDVVFTATGVTAVRIGRDGTVDRLAAGQLRSFVSDDLEINLDEPLDLAIWKDENNQWEGVWQGGKTNIPGTLLELTAKWTRLNVPEPYTGQGAD